MISDIIVKVVAESVYRCKNRTTKSNIRMTTLKIIIGRQLSFGYDICCDTHNGLCPQVNNKTDSLLAVRKPWMWCDGCREINDAIDHTCPDCGGAGELAGDYFQAMECILVEGVKGGEHYERRQPERII